ncbi:iron chaperone [Marmoricola sp. RAF53]|uniref:iron chaperone n=1 Tax=Marmoricola sp. RAF53 TaxID=3233059 RepID=UPI003F95A366
MTAAEIDAYLDGLPPEKRATLEALRTSILAVVPDAEQCISYSMPGFRVGGKVVAGFAAFKNHLSYFPHSGSVLPALGDAVAGYGGGKGTLQFPVDEPLPDDLVRLLVETRMDQLGLT